MLGWLQFPRQLVDAPGIGKSVFTTMRRTRLPCTVSDGKRTEDRLRPSLDQTSLEVGSDDDHSVLRPLADGDLGSKWTEVEGLWSTVSGVHKYLSYSTGATSSVSIGVSVADGSWVSGKDGNTSVTDTGGGQDFPELTGKTSRIGQTEMEEGFFNTCQISSEVATFPYAVDGGTRYVKSKPPKATHCVHEIKGSTLRMNRTQAFTFSDGINLQDVFGIDLSATTGYTKTASIKYVYSASDWACGTKSDPLRGSGVAHGVVADASVHGNK